PYWGYAWSPWWYGPYWYSPWPAYSYYPSYWYDNPPPYNTDSLNGAGPQNDQGAANSGDYSPNYGVTYGNQFDDNSGATLNDNGGFGENGPSPQPESVPATPAPETQPVAAAGMTSVV
ncbi:MAG: hypothetical protein WBW53_08820, partial [Terriglobales bacterium]